MCMVFTSIYFPVIYYNYMYMISSKDFKDNNLYYLTLYNAIKPSELIKYQARNIEVIHTTNEKINQNHITIIVMLHVAVQLL